MKIELRFFAALAERLDTRAERADTAAATVAELRQELAGRGGPWQALLEPQIKAAVNQTLARPDTPLAEGAEVAFFPPVTGG